MVLALTTYDGSSFTPLCGGSSPNIAVAGVTNAASAYDWFSLASGGSGALLTKYNLMTAGANKNMIASIAYEARQALMPLVKAEAYYSNFVSSKTLIASSIASISTTLTNIANPSFVSVIGTITPSYTASYSLITSTLNQLKSLEAVIYTSSSVDSSSATILANYAATPTATSFVGAKVFISNLLDPANLSNVGTIPSLTSVNGNAGNAATINTSVYIPAATALTDLMAANNLRAFNEMAAQNIFDLYCSAIQGYASSAYSGNYVGTTAPVGLVPGVDYITIVRAGVQSGAVASSGSPGAPSTAIDGTGAVDLTIAVLGLSTDAA